MDFISISCLTSINIYFLFLKKSISLFYRGNISYLKLFFSKFGKSNSWFFCVQILGFKDL